MTTRLQKYLIVTFLCVGAVSLHAQTIPVLPSDKVLASNQYATVTYADFEAELARIPPRDHYEFLLDRQRLAQLIDNILLNKTLALEAREAKLDNDPKVIAEIRNQTEKVLAKYRGQHVQSNVPVIDYNARARETYLANPERFTSPALYDVWHLLVGMKGRTAAEAKTRADEMRAKILAGESIEKLASMYSDDGSAAQNQGNLGLAELKNYDVRFAAAVRKLKEGEVSPVFESEYGFHVAKLREFRAPKKFPFELVKADLLYESETQHRLSVWENHLRKLRNDPKLIVDTDALEALRPKIPALPPLSPLAPAKTDTKK